LLLGTGSNTSYSDEYFFDDVSLESGTSRPSCSRKLQAITEGLGVNGSSILNKDQEAGGVTRLTGQTAEAEFTGRIIPGPLPVKTWWFRYYSRNAEHETTHEPPPSTGAAKVSAVGKDITPYVPASYDLVVEDTGGTQAVGALEPFVPGNLINPEGFTADGVYDLSIFCPSTCAALPIRGTAFGQLGAGGYDENNGEFGGVGILSSILANHQFGPSGSFVITSASMQLETVTVSVRATVGSSVPAFTLNGLVNDYGGPMDGFGPAVAYEPLLSGTVAGGGVWQACLVIDPVCAPSQQSDKTWAKVLSTAAGVGSLLTLKATPVSAALTVFGMITGAIANDPPDRHIKTRAKPLRIPRFSVSAGGGVGRKAAAATSRVINALAQTGSIASAFLDAIQRYQGALAIGEPKALAQQYQAAIAYGDQLVRATRSAADVLSRERGVIRRSALGASRVSMRELRATLRAVRRHGLPRGLASRLARFGVTAADVRAGLKLLPATPPASAKTPLGPILANAFVQQLRSFATALETYVAAFQQQPIA